MERPDLQRMLRSIERRQINLVITKDLSRLGRNYLQTGHLIEDFFPRNGVRYIAMNDGIDTLRDNNDIAPFKNILNEMYSKDISKKVHSSYLLKAQKGQFTGCLAPFGYRKDPEDKNHLLIDEETAPIVRLIFGYALNGHGPNYIRRRLEKEKIPCPTWWNRERGLRNTRTKWEKKDPENGRYMWDFSVIKDLLMNPVYTGAIASQKKDYRFKIGTIGEKKPEDWIVVEGQHEPLIDSMSFDIVQNKLKSRQRPGQTNEISLFAGLLKCGECGKDGCAVYGSLFLGKGAYGVVDLSEGTEVIVKPRGSSGTADPLDQRSSVGWKGVHAAAILYDEYMVRVECGSSYSGEDKAN